MYLLGDFLNWSSVYLVKATTFDNFFANTTFACLPMDGDVISWLVVLPKDSLLPSFLHSQNLARLTLDLSIRVALVIFPPVK